MNPRHPAWSPEELAALAEHYPAGGVPAVRRAGVTRSSFAIQARARKLGVRFELHVNLLGASGEGVLPTPLGTLPGLPRRVGDQLARLAEIRGLTLEEYEFAKVRILREGS